MGTLLFFLILIILDFTFGRPMENLRKKRQLNGTGVSGGKKPTHGSAVGGQGSLQTGGGIGSSNTLPQCKWFKNRYGRWKQNCNSSCKCSTRGGTRNIPILSLN